MKSKFNKTENYKNLCTIFSPHGLIKEGTVLTGEQWEKLLVFGVGNSFDRMFDKVL